MRIAFGTDHAGFGLRATVIELIEALGHEVLDLGAREYAADDDYPDFARAVAESLAGGGADRGVVLCGSGVGASVAANKVRGARAGVCHDTYSARQGVEHDDMNILCIGARIVGDALAGELVGAFVSAEFSGEERHRRRLGKVRDMEAGWPAAGGGSRSP